MKKILLAAFCFSFFILQGHAQRRRVSLDTYVEQSFMMGRWFPDRRMSHPLTRTSTDLSLRLNYRLSRKYGFWGQMAMSFDSGGGLKKKKRYVNLFHEFSPDLYYVKNLTASTHANFTPTLRTSFGGFARYRYKRWLFSPYIGYGIENIVSSTASYDLKEKGSNNMYTVKYTWVSDNAFKFLSFLTGEAKVSYIVSRNTDVWMGASYRSYITRVKFRRTISDFYRDLDNENVHLSRYEYRSNLLEGFGISLGMTFR